MSSEARQELEQLQARGAEEDKRLDLVDQRLGPLREVVARAEAKLSSSRRRRPWVVFVVAALLGLGLGSGVQVLARHVHPPTPTHLQGDYRPPRP